MQRTEWARMIISVGENVNGATASKISGLSVRCLQGNPVATIPTLFTMPASEILSNNATSGGDVMGNGGAAVTDRGGLLEHIAFS